MMDVDLPVWTIRPNWKAGVLERLEWLTDVIASETGVEQRRSVRQSPRRSFEFTVNPFNAERTYLDLVMHRLGSEEWLLPLWHDQGVLDVSGQAGQTALLFDNTFREFRDGDFAILYRDTFTWEVVEIDALNDDGVLLAEALETTWPRGTKVYPLRRATVQTETQISAITSRVGQSVLLFQLNEANDYPESTDGLTLYQGAPLIDQEPNRSQEITLSHTRLFSEQDGEIGLRYRTDDAGRAFAAQSHNWMVQGREAQSRFRSLLYYLRGQQRMVWLPSFNDDLFLTQPVAAGANRATIRKVGLGYVGGPIPGRARFWTGREVVLHASMVAAPTIHEERLALTAATKFAYTDRDCWSFLEPARLNSDTIEIQHHTDSDGTCEIATSFKTFANDRVAGLPIYLPAPEGRMNNVLCGTPGDADKNPCYVEPSDLRAILVMTATGQPPCNPTWDGNLTITFPRTQPNEGGNFFGDANHSNMRGSQPFVDYYKERYIEGHPFLGGQVMMEFSLTDFNTWTLKFFFDVDPGEWYVSIFPSARFCGSNGGSNGKWHLAYGRAGETPVQVGEAKDQGGNTLADWRWNG